jgi:hypothetical protein
MRKASPKISTLDDIRSKDGNLSIPLYVRSPAGNGAGGQDGEVGPDLPAALEAWLTSSRKVRRSLGELLAGASREQDG